MSRSSLHDSRRLIRQKIIRAASEVFGRYGYRKTTVEDIAAQLHMVKSSLYYYFRGKEEIFHAVVDCEAKKARRHLSAILEQNDDPRTRLRKYILTRMQALKDISERYPSIFDASLVHYDFIENIRRKYDRSERIVISRILKEGMNRDVFYVQDPHPGGDGHLHRHERTGDPPFLEEKGRTELPSCGQPAAPAVLRPGEEAHRMSAERREKR